jgi:hypothetical protein
MNLLYIKPTCISETKIGITFDLPKKDIDIFTNGIRQNAIFFYDLLKNIGYDVYFIVYDNQYEEFQKNKLFWHTDEYKYLKCSEILFSNFHIVVQFGFQIEIKTLNILKECNIRVIYYVCGNKYFIESETCLFKKDERITFQYNQFTKHFFNQIWLLPHHMNSCYNYIKTLYRSDVIEVPYIWSPSVIEKFQNKYYKDSSNNLTYINRGPNKKCVIFEPNISIMKWAFPALLACETAYRVLPDKNNIQKIYITNINSTSDKNKDTFNIHALNQMVKSLDLFNDKKIAIESRYVSLIFMSKYADIAVSHQIENNLNNLYFDIAWFGWPIVHNANLCKDVGYYYENSNFDMGSEMIQKVLSTHDNNIDEYIKTNRANMDRFLPTNKELQNHYKQLIDKLL